jgi:hypothetical protein
MVDLVEVPVGERPPADPNAFYVWAGTTGPVYGGYTAFEASRPPNTKFADGDWTRAIENAGRLARKTVYVVRNA